MKIINRILETWGRSRRETPINNEKLKMDILSKIPANPVKSPYAKHVRLPWLSFAFTAVAIIVFVVNSSAIDLGKRYATTGVGVSGSENVTVQSYPPQSPPSAGSGGSVSMDESKKQSMPSYISQPYYPYPQPEAPISDNREFLKLNYNATLRTRHVSDLETRVETIVRGFGGRVDSVSNTDKYGYVSFAVPKDKFEAFKLEIKSLVGSRFYIEQTNSQNLLPQKQMIEENQKQIEKNLSDLKTERAQIVRVHNQTISGYQTRINSINTEVASLNTEYKTATIARQAEITNRINQLQTEISTIESQLGNENRNYQTRISNVDSQIKYAQDSLRYVQTQDSNLIDNVATVNGTITLSWISLWDMADTYAPGPLLAWIFVLLAILAFGWYWYSIRTSYDF